MGRRAIKIYGFSAFVTIFYVNIFKVQNVSVTFSNVTFSLPLEMSRSFGFSKSEVIYIVNIQKVSKFNGFLNEKVLPTTSSQSVILFEQKHVHAKIYTYFII